jgi:hypothetical protein
MGESYKLDRLELRIDPLAETAFAISSIFFFFKKK